ncbi:SEN2 subunit of the tRNA splicing endonuclease-like protein [Dipodascopsis uninucleata]
MGKKGLNSIYKSSLPVETVALPLLPLVLHNPVSVAYYVYYVLKSPLFWGFKKSKKYVARVEMHKDRMNWYVSSIVVDSMEDMQGLWRAGFFGKGTQSRSEPTWEQRTVRRLKELAADESAIAPEEVTAQRRQTRKKFKQARALVEQGLSQNEALVQNDSGVDSCTQSAIKLIREEDRYLLDYEGNLRKLEVLQLTPEEAFFLAYGLGVLDVYDDYTGDVVSVPQLLGIVMPDWNPDNSFILKYVVYHHFRSRGWCVRDGVKFGVDYLLYRRGPPFSHAEFGVLVVPTYQNESQNRNNRLDWFLSTGVNRIIGGVKKTMVLCYVEVPESIERWMSVEEMLKRYCIREVTIRRWVASKHRD